MVCIFMDLFLGPESKASLSSWNRHGYSWCQKWTYWTHHSEQREMEVYGLNLHEGRGSPGFLIPGTWEDQCLAVDGIRMHSVLLLMPFTDFLLCSFIWTGFQIVSSKVKGVARHVWPRAQVFQECCVADGAGLCQRALEKCIMQNPPGRELTGGCPDAGVSLCNPTGLSAYSVSRARIWCQLTRNYGKQAAPGGIDAQ